jgi:hypothetical protein
MAKLPNIDDMIKTNPKVDPKELEKGLELLRQLRERGVSGSPHKLASPLSRRRARIDEEPSKDPRTVQLRNRR